MARKQLFDGLNEKWETEAKLYRTADARRDECVSHPLRNCGVIKIAFEPVRVTFFTAIVRLLFKCVIGKSDGIVLARARVEKREISIPV